jgi:hypothetical protein
LANRPAGDYWRLGGKRTPFRGVKPSSLGSRHGPSTSSAIARCQHGRWPIARVSNWRLRRGLAR